MDLIPKWKGVQIFLVTLSLFALIGCGLQASRSDVPPIYVEESGIGVTEALALKDAFRNAVQKASGVFLSSSMKLDGNQIVVDETNEYSSGIIVSFDVKNTKFDSGMYKVEIGALVSSSRLLDYYASRRIAQDGKIPGAQMYAQLYTDLKSRQQGDRFIQSLATEYPEGAIVMKVSKISARINQDRIPEVVVSYNVGWAPDYFEALDEIVRYVSVGSCGFGTSRNPRVCDFDVKLTEANPLFDAAIGYRLVDNRQTQILTSSMQPQVGLLATFFDESQNKVGALCENIWLPTDLLSNYDAKVEFGNHKFSASLVAYLDEPGTMKKITSVELRALRACK